MAVMWWTTLRPGHDWRQRRPKGRRYRWPRAFAIVIEGAWFAHQPVDHVPVVDSVLPLPAKARNPFNVLAREPDFQHLGVEANVYSFANQAAVHRVRVSVHVDRAAGADSNPRSFVALQPGRRERTQQGLFLGEAFLAACYRHKGAFHRLAFFATVVGLN
jgi:hypothetical protein